jgi:cytochrome c553
MRSWRLACAVFLSGSMATGVTLFACDTGNDGFKFPNYGSGADADIEGDSATAMAARAEAAFRALEGDFKKACANCHGDAPVGGAPPFLKGPDSYVAIRNHPGVIVEDVSTSKILTKGQHAGPALSGPYQDLGNRLTGWLNLEADILRSKALPTTDPVALVIGANSIDVSKCGKGVDGSKVTFDAQKNGNIITLTKLSFVAPASTAVRVRHPIFMIVPDQGKPTKDPVDSLSTVDSKVAAGATAVLGPGQMFLLNWVDSNKIAISFESLEVAPPIDGGSEGGAGGCKSVATFQSSATPVLQGNTCLTCHQGQNPTATAALDLSKLTTDPPTACGQALAKINKADKPNSVLIKRPTVAGDGHPYAVPAGNVTAFSDGILGWANNE